MTFTMTIFLPFMLLILLFLKLVKSENGKKILIVFASSVFYLLWDPRFLILLFACAIMACIGTDFLFSEKILNRKRITIIFIIAYLIILGIFKYKAFFYDGLKRLLKIQDFSSLAVILPIGISFYIFSCISLIIDVYRFEIEEKPTAIDIFTYVLFFPKLLQGPLHKASDFMVQLKKDHIISKENILTGIQIFLFGLIKKVVIADRLGLFIDTVYQKPGVYSGATLLLLAITYPVYLYCDFSGYSDMAVGTAKMMGYDLCQNFNLPFMAKNVSEYWRRWHISLNVWFRDYLFYPIVRSKWVNNIRRSMKERSKKLSRIIPPIIGMAVVWPLTGLWHGASLNFVIYGVFYGLLMTLSLIREEFVPHKSKLPIVDVLRIFRTWVVTIIAMVIYRSPDLKTVGTILSGIIRWKSGISYLYTWSLIYVPVIIIAMLIAYKKNDGNGEYIIMDLRKFWPKFLICFAALMTVVLMYIGENYFVYFNF